jgi:tyrosyl-tRNA synthetase
MPLIMTAAGTKFGKTEAGAVWLDPAKTSPFHFYQFWLNVDDRDVVSYLKYFTFLGEAEIGDLERQLRAHPEARGAQRELAREVTGMVHGADQVQRAERVTAVLFSESLANVTVDDILTVFIDAPAITLPLSALQAGMANTEIAVATGLAGSKAEAARLIKQGGLYLNNRRLTDERSQATMADAIGGEVLVMRKGQREPRIVKIQK